MELRGLFVGLSLDERVRTWDDYRIKGRAVQLL